MELSFWEKENLLAEDKTVIVGAGIVGLCTAIYCKMKNPDSTVIVLERGTESSGASTKNAGFACFGSASEILSDIKNNSEEEVFYTVMKRYQGLKRLFSLVDISRIDYHNHGGIEVFRSVDKVPTKEEVCRLNEMMADYLGIRDVYQWKTIGHSLGFEKAIIYNSYEGQLNPYKMINMLKVKAISIGITIYYNREVEEIKINEQTLDVKDVGIIPYQKLAICTNGFARQLWPSVNVQPARNQVLITEPIKDLEIKGSYHCDRGYLYFRNYKRRIILGGGRNISKEEESTSEFGISAKIRTYLTDFLHQYILPDQEVKIAHWWSGIMGLGDSKKVIVQRVAPNVYVGVRLGGMGVAIGSEIGFELSELMNT